MSLCEKSAKMSHLAFSMQNYIYYFRWAAVRIVLTKLFWGETIIVKYGSLLKSTFNARFITPGGVQWINLYSSLACQISRDAVGSIPGWDVLAKSKQLDISNTSTIVVLNSKHNTIG